MLKEADSTEETCVEEFLQIAVWEKIVDSDIYNQLWKIYTKSKSKNNEKDTAWASLKILWIASEFKEIRAINDEELTADAKSEIDLNHPDYLLVREMIKAWEKCHQKWNKGDIDVEKIDKFIFSMIISLVKTFGTDDAGWNCAAE